jgi:hypothetical protein
MQSYYVSALLAKQLFWTSKVSLQGSWEVTEKLRSKLFFELVVFFLGPGGNNLLLMVFWPGWIVVGGGVYGICWIVG